MVRLRNSVLAALGMTEVAILAPSLAGAATVEVTVEQSTHSLVFSDAGGELNTVSLGAVGDSTTYAVTDSTAPIVAGPGCSGGGPAGSTATCPLPRSAQFCHPPGCPSTAEVSVRLEADLGGGNDSLDSTGMPARDGGTGSFTVHGNGGPGDDSFLDGPIRTTFDPGTGADRVDAGDGDDTVLVSGGAPDQADVYDLGAKPGDHDYIDYSAATYPVSVSLDGIANDGAPGEADQVLGAEEVLGGTADDVLIAAAGAEPYVVSGSAGNDLIIGGAGNDSLAGDGGDDTIRGQAGNDRLDGDSFDDAGGDDVLAGGTGRDLVRGARGSDRLRGGFGSDLLLGSTALTSDRLVDLIDCGPSRDRRAYVGPEDVVRRCERTRGPSVSRARLIGHR